jgi:hypothetical protein
MSAVEARVAMEQSRQVTAFLAGMYRSAPGAPPAEVLRQASQQLGSFALGEPAWKLRARSAVAESMMGAHSPADAATLLTRMVEDNQRLFAEPNLERVREMTLLGEARLSEDDARQASLWFRRALDERRLLEVTEWPAPGHLEARLNDALGKIRR